MHDPLDLWHQGRRWNAFSFINLKPRHWGFHSSPLQLPTQMFWTCTSFHVLYQVCDRQVPSTRGRGKPTKSCYRSENNKFSECGLSGIDQQDIDIKKAGVWCCLMLPTPLNGTRGALLSHNGYDDAAAAAVAAVLWSRICSSIVNCPFGHLGIPV